MIKVAAHRPGGCLLVLLRFLWFLLVVCLVSS